jgi:hypothetical protein
MPGLSGPGFGIFEGIFGNRFAAAAIFTSHLVAVNHPVMGSAGTFFTFPSLRSNKFLIFRYFQGPLHRRHLLISTESYPTDSSFMREYQFCLFHTMDGEHIRYCSLLLTSIPGICAIRVQKLLSEKSTDNFW